VSPARRGCGDERGSATLLVALGCMIVAMVAAGGLVLGSVLVVRTRVAAAADLGSLAAASAVLEPDGIACARAREIVRANGAALARCSIEGAQVRVEVVGRAPAAVAWLTGGRTAQLRARAHAALVPAVAG
jgi:secretion/DNA translocation related TadE-like protein